MDKQKINITKDYIYRTLKACLVIFLCVITVDGARKHLKKWEAITETDWWSMVSWIDNNSTAIWDNTTEISNIKTKNTSQDTSISNIDTKNNSQDNEITTLKWKVDTLEMAGWWMIVWIYTNYPKYCRWQHSNSGRCSWRTKATRWAYFWQVTCSSTSCSCKSGLNTFTVKGWYVKDTYGNMVYSTNWFCYK